MDSVSIQELRQEQIDVDIIAVTAANDTQTVKTLLRHGAIDYIVKPFTFERLQQAFKQYNDRYRQLNQCGEISQDKLDRVLSAVKKDDAKMVAVPRRMHQQTFGIKYSKLPFKYRK